MIIKGHLKPMLIMVIYLENSRTFIKDQVSAVDRVEVIEIQNFLILDLITVVESQEIFVMDQTKVIEILKFSLLDLSTKVGKRIISVADRAEVFKIQKSFVVDLSEEVQKIFVAYQAEVFTIQKSFVVDLSTDAGTLKLFVTDQESVIKVQIFEMNQNLEFMIQIFGPDYSQVFVDPIFALIPVMALAEEPVIQKTFDRVQEPRIVMSFVLIRVLKIQMTFEVRTTMFVIQMMTVVVWFMAPTIKLKARAISVTCWTLMVNLGAPLVLHRCNHFIRCLPGLDRSLIHFIIEVECVPRAHPPSFDTYNFAGPNLTNMIPIQLR